MSVENVKVHASGSVAEVVLSRPPVNAVTTALYEALITTFDELSDRQDINVIILRSSLPNAFSAGADLKEVVTSPSRAETPAKYRARLARTCFDTLLNCAQPTIAVVDGYALGTGAVLAGCCDIRYASASARIGLPEINVGRCGGGRHLMRLIPQGKLRMMYFTGEPVDALEALRLDLVQVVLPSDEVLDAARALAQKIAAKSPLGLRYAKRALNECEAMDVSTGYAHEQSYTLRLAQLPDTAAAVRPTLENRPPVWRSARDEASRGRLTAMPGRGRGSLMSGIKHDRLDTVAFLYKSDTGLVFVEVSPVPRPDELEG